MSRQFKPTYGSRRGGARYYARPNRNVQRRVRAKLRQQAPKPYTEMKGMDTVLEHNTIVATTSTNDNVDIVNLIQIGTGSWNRMGKRTQSRSLRIRGYAKFLQAPTGSGGDISGNGLRIVVVHDKQPSQGPIPIFSDIFGYTLQDGSENSISFANTRYDNTDRFTVVRDKVCTHNTQAIDTVGTTNINTGFYYVDEYMKLNIGSVYSGQTVPMTIADISTGAIYIYFRSEVNLAHSSIDFEGTARLRYTD